MQRKASQSRRSRLRLLVILAIIRALLIQCGFWSPNRRYHRPWRTRRRWPETTIDHILKHRKCGQLSYGILHVSHTWNISCRGSAGVARARAFFFFFLYWKTHHNCLMAEVDKHSWKCLQTLSDLHILIWDWKNAFDVHECICLMQITVYTRKKVMLRLRNK